MATVISSPSGAPVWRSDRAPAPPQIRTFGEKYRDFQGLNLVQMRGSEYVSLPIKATPNADLDDPALGVGLVSV
jgi:hypothetical protein